MGSEPLIESLRKLPPMHHGQLQDGHEATVVAGSCRSVAALGLHRGQEIRQETPPCGSTHRPNAIPQRLVVGCRQQQLLEDRRKGAVNGFTGTLQSLQIGSGYGSYFIVNQEVTAGAGNKCLQYGGAYCIFY